jgi:hypothetical protein
MLISKEPSVSAVLGKFAGSGESGGSVVMRSFINKVLVPAGSAPLTYRVAMRTASRPRITVKFADGTKIVVTKPADPELTFAELQRCILGDWYVPPERRHARPVTADDLTYANCFNRDNNSAAYGLFGTESTETLCAHAWGDRDVNSDTYCPDPKPHVGQVFPLAVAGHAQPLIGRFLGGEKNVWTRTPLS